MNQNPDAPSEPSSNPTNEPALDPELQKLQLRMLELQDRGKNGAHWFYWVAGLSLVNSLCALGGINRRFVFGLGVTEAVDDHFGGVPAFAFSVAVAALMVFFGWASNKRSAAIFAVGMVLYLLDGLLLVKQLHYFHAAFHAFVLFQMWQGLTAYRELSKILSSQPATA